MDERSNQTSENTGLRDVGRFISRNRWWVLSAPLVMLLFTAIFVSVVTPVYEGAATIRIDKKRSELGMLSALQDLSSGSEINTEMAELRSRTLAEEVVDGLRLRVSVDEPRRVPRSELFSVVSADREGRSQSFELKRISTSEFELVSENGGKQRVRPGVAFRTGDAVFTLTNAALEHERIAVSVRPFQESVQLFQNILVVDRPDREAGIVAVHYETTDRALARDVPNEVADRFIARRQHVQTAQARNTVTFLQEQIDTLSSQLRDYETGLRQFREGESVVSLEAEGEAEVKRLADFQANRDILDAERRSLAQLMNEVNSTQPLPGEPSPYRRLIGFPTLLSNPAATELLSTLHEIDNERSELLRKRTENDPDVLALTKRGRDVEQQIATLTATYLDGITNRMNSLDVTLAGFAQDLKRIPAKEIQLARLKRQARVSEDLYVTLQQRMKEAQIVTAAQDLSVRVVDPAVYPLRPIKPNVPLSLLLALVLGTILGALIGYIREHLDTTIHTREELQGESGVVPVLGSIPRIIPNMANGNGAHRLWRRPARVSNRPEDRRSRLVVGNNAATAVSEAFRSLRTSIAFSRPEKAPRTIVFTSSAPGDGKSTSAANLAITLAQQKLRCIVIDADMRRGTLHDAFGTTSKPGLSNYLLGGLSLEEIIKPVTLEGDVRFDFISCGTLPPNPAELLASTRMQALLEHLEGQYDSVIFDAPPLNVVTDAALLGARVDGVILVVRAGMTDRVGFKHALAQLASVHARILGCLLNDVDARREKLYGEYVAGEY